MRVAANELTSSRHGGEDGEADDEGGDVAPVGHVDAAGEHGADEHKRHAELPEEDLEGADVGQGVEHAGAEAADVAAPEVLAGGYIKV